LAVESSIRPLQQTQAGENVSTIAGDHWLAVWKRLRDISIVVFACAGVGMTWAGLSRPQPGTNSEHPARAKGEVFYPTAAQWGTFTFEPVRQTVFRPVYVTEGKIAVNEDQATPVYSPYSGRIIKLLAKPGDRVERGQPLFILEATDAVQVHNDFLTAITALNKARAQLNLAQTVERRLGSLYEGKAIALREWQQAQADLVNALNDVTSMEAALEAARNRLRIMGRTDEEIAKFQERRTITPETPIFAPISGLVVQRKVGPGQYITAGASDPAFLIGDLSTVWVTAFVRETETPNVRVGQAVSFKVLAFPEQIFNANISYVSTSIDANSRRLLVRAVINNSDGLLRPEMFANVSISTDEGDNALSVPRIAVIYEGEMARVWVVREDRGLELRRIKPGMVNGPLIQVKDGLRPGEKVVTKGSLFIDREATAN
jgi:membrane fusion protein, heavy metal efflux system